MHLLLLQLAAFLIEQVGILIDEVKVVTRSNGHCVTATLGQTVVCLKEVKLTSIIYVRLRKFYNDLYLRTFPNFQLLLK